MRRYRNRIFVALGLFVVSGLAGWIVARSIPQRLEVDSPPAQRDEKRAGNKRRQQLRLPSVSLLASACLFGLTTPPWWCRYPAFPRRPCL